jgi:hypothetical protein
MYLRYGWAGLAGSFDGGGVVQAYAAHYNLPVHRNDGSSVPSVGDVMSFSPSPDFTGGHVAIVTSVNLKTNTGSLTLWGQNWDSGGLLVPMTVSMAKTPGGWKLLTSGAIANVEWLHAQPIITFSEFPVGTSITNQYQTDGIVFTGDNPYITTDGSNPTSPVLSGTPRFQGSITGTFFVPGTTAPQRTGVLAFSVDVGYIDNPNSVEVVYFDIKGKRLGSLLASAFGIDTLNVTSSIPIGSFTVHSVTNEPYGWAIDNVAIHF